MRFVDNPLKASVSLDMNVSQVQNVGSPELLPCNVAQTTNEGKELDQISKQQRQVVSIYPFASFHQPLHNTTSAHSIVRPRSHLNVLARP